MQWKTLFSIDPVEPLSIACLIHRARKKNYHFSLRYTGPRSNSLRFRNGRFTKFEHERCEKKVDSTWTLLKCYKVYSSFKSIFACFLVLPKESWIANIRTPPPTWYTDTPNRTLFPDAVGTKTEDTCNSLFYFKIRISQVYIAIAAEYFGRVFENLLMPQFFHWS